jgi:hypothetical protein
MTNELYEFGIWMRENWHYFAEMHIKIEQQRSNYNERCQIREIKFLEWEECIRRN